MAHFLTPLLRSPEPCGLLHERTHTWLAERLELASDSATRKKGLLGRDALEAGRALVIAPTQGVHTFGMRFPIDIVAVSRDGRVVKYRGRVPSRRIVLAWSAFAIIELPAGTCDCVELAPHDRLLVAKIDDRSINRVAPAAFTPSH